MIKWYVLIFTLIVLMISGCITEVTKEKEIPFENLEIGYISGRADNNFFIILNDTDLHKLYDTGIYVYMDVDDELKKSFKTSKNVDLSKIDFDDYFIIVVIHPNQHMDIKVKKINQIENILSLVVETKSSESRYLDAEMFHYNIVKIKKSDLIKRSNLTFIFVDEKEGRSCNKSVDIL
ncbi:MAG: hypothetical protein GW770_04210 [Candidatus Altiarchaeum hamiconexum]|nr:hypothetical protein [Candidatus Altarchaeum hamiconexum]